MPHIAFIGLGSNMGDRELNLLRGVAELGKLPLTKITALSGFWETEAVGPPQDDYVNAAARIETELSPHDLLNRLQSIEAGIFNRRRDLRWGPRTLDLDILLYDDLVCSDPDVEIPHPRLQERRFVLAPLAEIAADIRHPASGFSIAELLQRLPEGQRVRRLEE